MYLVAGLGNPGGQYENTRHNAGFMALDEFQKKNSFPEFTESAKHKAELSEGMIGDEKVILAKPATFMNNSGEAVRSLLANRSGLPHLIVVHDDIDIVLGNIKIVKARESGSGGHKGVDSIIQALGTKSFARVKIGIQPSEGKPENTEQFVLQKFSPKERELLYKALREAAQALIS